MKNKDEKFIKDKLDSINLIEFGGANISEMLDTVVESSAKTTLRKNFTFFTSTFFFHNYEVKQIGSGKNLFLFSLSYLKRADHLRIAINTATCCDNTTFFKAQKCFRISLLKMKLIPKFFKWVRKLVNEELNLNSAIYLSLMLFNVYYSAVFIDDFIKKHNLRSSCLVTVCDAHPVDYYMTYMFKGRGIKTITLQHGIFCRYGSWVFKNSHSDFFLAYNQMTLNEAKNSGYCDNGKMLIVGPPALIGVQRINNFEQRHTYTIGVALVGKAFVHHNIKILDCIKGLNRRYSNIRFMIRDHADINTNIDGFENFYRASNESIDQFIKSSDFIITGNSTVFFEAFMKNTMAIRLKTDKDIYSSIEEFCFSTSKELEIFIDSYYNDFPNLLKKAKEVSNVLIPNGNIELNYKNFFDELNISGESLD